MPREVPLGEYAFFEYHSHFVIKRVQRRAHFIRPLRRHKSISGLPLAGYQQLLHNAYIISFRE